MCEWVCVCVCVDMRGELLCARPDFISKEGGRGVGGLQARVQSVLDLVLALCPELFGVGGGGSFENRLDGP